MCERQAPNTPSVLERAHDRQTFDMTDAVGDLDYSGKRVLVVGGSSGIGNAIARGFRDRRADVHVWGTRAHAEDYANSPDSDLSGLRYLQMDVSEAQRVQQCEPGFDALDVLVLAQGMVLYDRAEFDPISFRKVVEVNLNSIMDCCMKFYRQLVTSRGAIVIVSSTAAFHATRGNPAYCASKTGAMGLTRTLGDAWARDGVRVNGIAPGMVPTKMTKVTTENPKRSDALREQIPLCRFGTTEEIAAVALFLASPLASYVVGQTLVVDGGLTLR